MWWTLLMACLTSPASFQPAPPVVEVAPLRQVHVTIDDLPWQVERGQTVALSPLEVARWNQRLIDVLAKHRVEASVFFNCDRLQDGDNTVALWAHANHALGNHTAGHLPAREVGPAAFLADVASCQEILATAVASPVPWFRYPYLGYGADAASQIAIADGLGELGLRNLPVTATTSDWVLSTAYREALVQGDEAAQLAIRDELVEHLVQSVFAAERIAQAVEGRAVPQTVLIHLNELSAHSLDQVLLRFEAEGITFVSADVVMADPVFAKPIVKVDPFAEPWLLRSSFPVEGQDDVVGWFNGEESRLTKKYPLPPKPWHGGLKPVPETPEEFVAWMRPYGYLGTLRRGSWPTGGKAKMAPAMPDDGALMVQLSNVEGDVSADVWCTAQAGSHDALVVLANWVEDPQGLDRTAVAVRVGQGGCVVAAASSGAEGVLAMAIDLAGAEPL